MPEKIPAALQANMAGAGITRALLRYSTLTHAAKDRAKEGYVMAMLFAVPRLVLVSKRLGRTAPVWRGHHLNFFPQEVSALFRRENRLAHALRRRTYRLTGCLTRALFMVDVRDRKAASMSRLRFTLAAAALFAVSAYLAQKPLVANDSEIRVTA